jgi:hypothetical protein
MAYDLPDDLIDAQRRVFDLHIRCQAIADAMPSNLAVLALEADVSDEQRQELDDVRAERLQAIGVLYDHPWWDTLPKDERQAAREQLWDAASAK